MSRRITRVVTDPTQPPLLPPLYASIPPSLRRREFDPDDRSTWGDQSIVPYEEDERILDKVWAAVARHPRMDADPDLPDAPASNGAPTNGRLRRRRRAPAGSDAAETEATTAAFAPRPVAK